MRSAFVSVPVLSVMGTILLWGQGGAAASLDSGKPSVAAIVVGGDAAAAGELQRDLVEKIGALSQVSVRSTAEIGTRLAVPDVTAPARTAERVRAESALLDQAKASYFRDKGAQALDQLTELARMQAADPEVPNGERVRLHLWKMAVLLALNDKEQSEAEALAALALDPKLEVDPKDFAPTVQEAIADLRTRRMQTATVLLSGLSAGARASVDGRPVSDRFEVGAGTHRIVVTAPGRRVVSESFEALSDRSLRISSPLLLDSAMNAELSDLARRGSGSPPDARLLATLATRLDCSWLVLVSEKESTAQAVIVSLPDGRRGASGPATRIEDAATLAEWAPGKLASLVSGSTVVVRPTPMPHGTVAPTPLPAFTPASSLNPNLPGSVSVEARGGADISQRAINVSGSGNNPHPYKGSFTGVGPALGAELTYRALVATADASWLDYSGSFVTVTLPGSPTSQVTLHGGTTWAGSVGAGLRFGFQGDPDTGSSLSLLVAGSTEHHAAQTVASVPLFPSYARNALEGRVQLRVPLFLGSSPGALILGAGVAPFSTWTESPAGTTGTSPSAAVGASWMAALWLRPLSRLSIGAGYSGEERSISFSGSSGSPSNLTSAKQTELWSSFHLDASWGF